MLKLRLLLTKRLMEHKLCYLHNVMLHNKIFVPVMKLDDFFKAGNFLLSNYRYLKNNFLRVQISIRFYGNLFQIQF